MLKWVYSRQWWWLFGTWGTRWLIGVDTGGQQHHTLVGFDHGGKIKGDRGVSLSLRWRNQKLMGGNRGERCYPQSQLSHPPTTCILSSSKAGQMYWDLGSNLHMSVQLANHSRLHSQAAPPSWSCRAKLINGQAAISALSPGRPTWILTAAGPVSCDLPILSAPKLGAQSQACFRIISSSHKIWMSLIPDSPTGSCCLNKRNANSHCYLWPHFLLILLPHLQMSPIPESSWMSGISYTFAFLLGSFLECMMYGEFLVHFHGCYDLHTNAGVEFLVGFGKI